jgi:hypothetical protein
VVQYDGKWYRGVLEEIKGDRLLVHCVDYGFTHTGTATDISVIVGTEMLLKSILIRYWYRYSDGS